MPSSDARSVSYPISVSVNFCKCSHNISEGAQSFISPLKYEEIIVFSWSGKNNASLVTLWL